MWLAPLGSRLTSLPAVSLPQALCQQVYVARWPVGVRAIDQMALLKNCRASIASPGG